MQARWTHLQYRGRGFINNKTRHIRSTCLATQRINRPRSFEPWLPWSTGQLQTVCDVTCHAFPPAHATVCRAARQKTPLKMLRNFVGGLFYLLVLYFAATLGSIFLMGPFLPLLWLRPSWFRWINDRLIVSWLLLPPVSKSSDFFSRNVSHQFLSWKKTWFHS